MVLKKSAIALALLFAAISVFALDVPPLTGRVVDNANIMTSAEKQELTNYLASLEEMSGVQIAVLTIPSLEGEDIETFGMRVVETWKLGQAKEDNGALLLVALAEHRIRIEVGYGLEGKLTDTKCGLIIRNVIAPRFQSGDYGAGIITGAENMGGIATDNAALVSKSVSEESGGSPLPALLFGLLFYLAWITIIPNLAYRRNIFIPWYFFPKYRRMINRDSSRGGTHYGGSRFGRSSGGGFSGGFSGGGGGFGGGGASGRW